MLYSAFTNFMTFEKYFFTIGLVQLNRQENNIMGGALMNNRQLRISSQYFETLHSPLNLGMIKQITRHELNRRLAIFNIAQSTRTNKTLQVKATVQTTKYLS